MIKRSDFPILKKKINGHNMIYFDNAATSQKPTVLIKSLENYYSKYNANVHRGLNPLAEEATRQYEEARKVLAQFVSASLSETIFTRGATEGINLIARTWGEDNLQAGDIVVLSRAEHHANIVPWLQLQKKKGIKLLYIPLHQNGELDMKIAQELLSKKRVKLLAITQASNVLGIMNHLEKIISFAHSKKIITVVDAAQSIAHFPLNFKDLNCDFLVFSGHKIYGPTGIGLLYGRQELLEKMSPFLGGGEMIKSVYTDHFTINDLPYKFEAGTPPIAEAIALAESIKYLQKVSWKEIIKKEKELSLYFQKRLQDLKFIKILGEPRLASDKLALFSLIIKNIHPHDAADILGQEGVILRAGNHCAQPVHDFYQSSASLRASLSFYNTKKEIDIFIKKLLSLHQAWK